MNNKQCLYLCHYTKEEKAAYNRQYYQEHKELWDKYDAVKSKEKDMSPARAEALKTLYAKSAHAHSVAKSIHDATRNLETYNYSTPGVTPSQAKRTINTDPRYDGLYGKTNLGGKAVGSSPYQDQTISGTTGGRSLYYENKLRSYATGRSYSGVLTPSVKRSPISSLAASAVYKGKSIVKGFTSLWKLGWK